MCPWPSICFHTLRANSWSRCPQLPYHPSKNETHSTSFCSTRGHTPDAIAVASDLRFEVAAIRVTKLVIPPLKFACHRFFQDAEKNFPKHLVRLFSASKVTLKFQRLPFTPKFLQINSLPVFFCNFFCNFYRNSLRPPIFSVTPMRSSGSRVAWKIFFVIFTKLIPRNIFCIAKCLVLMVFLKCSNKKKTFFKTRF